MNRQIRYNQIQSLGKKTQKTQSDIEVDNTCFQMSTIPKTLHLPICYSATLFSDSLRVRINPEIKKTGIQLEKTNPDTPSAALHQLAIQLYSWSWNRIVNRRSAAQNQALINKTSKDNLIGFKCYLIIPNKHMSQINKRQNRTIENHSNERSNVLIPLIKT
jgi:hypothetical protein